MPEEMLSAVSVDPAPQSAEPQGSAVDTSTADLGVEGVEQPDTESQQPQQSDEFTDGDGRTLPAALKKHLAQLAQDPTQKAFANQLKGMYFTLAKYREIFPNARTAQEAKEFLESTGGTEAIDSLRSQIDEADNEIRRFEAGDSTFINELADSSPQAFTQLMPAALQKFAQVNPEAYNHALARIMTSTFDQQGIPNALANLEWSLKNKPEEAANIVAEFKQFFADLKALGERAPEKKTDPREQELNDRQQALDQREQREFHGGIVREVHAHQRAEVRKQAEQQFKRKLSDEEFEDFHADVIRRIRPKIDADGAYNQKLQRLMQGRNRDGMVNAEKEMLAKLLPEAVQRSYRAFTSLGGGKAAEMQKRAATNAARPDLGRGSGGGNNRPAKPKPNEIDWSRSNREDVLGGKGYIKGVKEIQQW